MSIQIGKLLPDGSVRHIKALHETLSKDLVRKLRVFYPNDRRVDALLSLGKHSINSPFHSKNVILLL